MQQILEGKKGGRKKKVEMQGPPQLMEETSEIENSGFVDLPKKREKMRKRAE